MSSKNLQDLNYLSSDSTSENPERDYYRPSVIEFGESKDSDIDYFSSLTFSKAYKDIIEKVDDVLSNKHLDEHAHENPITLLTQSCQLIGQIDDEMLRIYHHIRCIYRTRFPELESLVHQPLEYARVIKAIGKEEDISQVDLSKVAPLPNVMMLTITAASTSGKTLSNFDSNTVLKGCDIIIRLNADKTSILFLIEQKMNTIAPNLSGLLGTPIAANLITAAGGLVNLSKMPGCNIQILGTTKKLQRFNGSRIDDQTHRSFIFTCEIVQQTPPVWKHKALKLVSSKCALLVRIDTHGHDTSGNEGLKVREEILAQIEKWQELPTSQLKKALPVPDSVKNKKRGGKRLRKFKERYGITRVHHSTNRIGFNQSEKDIIGGDEFIGLGLLGEANVNYGQKIEKKHGSKKLTHNNVMVDKDNNGVYGWSSLAFTPYQGLELHNPFTPTTLDIKNGNESYFSEEMTSTSRH